MVVVYEKKNRSLVFSGDRKIPTLGSTVQWETRQASFPTGMVGPRVGIFLSPLNTNDGFYFSHILMHTRSSDLYVSSLSEKSVPHPYPCEIIHWCHCVVSLSKTHLSPCLVLVQPRKTCPCLTERLLMGLKESNQTNKQKPLSCQSQLHCGHTTLTIWVLSLIPVLT